MGNLPCGFHVLLEQLCELRQCISHTDSTIIYKKKKIPPAINIPTVQIFLKIHLYLFLSYYFLDDYIFRYPILLYKL